MPPPQPSPQAPAHTHTHRAQPHALPQLRCGDETSGTRAHCMSTPHRCTPPSGSSDSPDVSVAPPQTKRTHSRSRSDKAAGSLALGRRVESRVEATHPSKPAR
eukprot:6171538-Prymnesium_polylepis.1